MSKSPLPERPKTPERRSKRPPTDESPVSVVGAWNRETGMSKDTDAQRLAGLMDVYTLIAADPEWSSRLTVHGKLSLIQTYLLASAVDYQAVTKIDDKGSTHAVILTEGSDSVTKVSKAYLNTMALLLYVNVLDTGIEPKENFDQLIKSASCPGRIEEATLRQAKQILVEEINRWEKYEARNGRVKDGIPTTFISPNRSNPVARIVQKKVSVVQHSDQAIVNAMLRYYEEKQRFALDPSPANWATRQDGLRLLDTKFAIQVPAEDDGYVSDHSDKFVRISKIPEAQEDYLKTDNTLIQHGYVGSARLRRLFVSLLSLNIPPLAVSIIRSLHEMGRSLFKFPEPVNARQYCVFSKEAKTIIDPHQVDVSPGKKSRRSDPSEEGSSSSNKLVKKLF